MELLLHLALLVAAVAHGAARMARAEVDRLARMRAARRNRPVTITLTADRSQFEAAMERARRATRSLTVIDPEEPTCPA